LFDLLQIKYSIKEKNYKLDKGEFCLMLWCDIVVI